MTLHEALKSGRAIHRRTLRKIDKSHPDPIWHFQYGTPAVAFSYEGSNPDLSRHESDCVWRPLALGPGWPMDGWEPLDAIPSNVIEVDFRRGPGPVVDGTGDLTPRGFMVCHEYATAWLDGIRRFELERAFPELADGPFAAIRREPACALVLAAPVEEAEVLLFPALG